MGTTCHALTDGLQHGDLETLVRMCGHPRARAWRWSASSECIEKTLAASGETNPESLPMFGATRAGVPEKQKSPRSPDPLYVRRTTPSFLAEIETVPDKIDETTSTSDF